MKISPARRWKVKIVTASRCVRFAWVIAETARQAKGKAERLFSAEGGVAESAVVDEN